MSTFLRIRGGPNRETQLGEFVRNVNCGARAPEHFRCDPESFASLPGSPFAYWAPETIRSAFRRLPALESGGRESRSGVSTKDDERFLRIWWEPSTSTWHSHAKGGGFAPFYGDIVLTINWGSDGRELLTERVTSRTYATAIVPNPQLYFLPGLTWSLRTTKSLSTRVLPRGVVFGSKGPAITFPAHDGTERRLALLAVTSSHPFQAALAVQVAAADAAARSYEVGVLGSTPVPSTGVLTGPDGATLALCAQRAWSLRRALDTITETSHAFHLPALLQVEGPTLSDRAAAWSARVAATEAELATIQREIDDIAFRLYGIDGEDRARIEAESGAAPAAASTDEEAPDEEAEADDGPDDEEEDTSTAADAATLATELLSWAVGVAFGRFDIDYARGLREPPPEPGPFDPLPARSPGMSPDDCPAIEVLVDEEGHPEDLVRRVTDIFAHAFGPWHDERLDEAVQLVGAPDLRTWLRRSFFSFHLKRYSKSRRKAPIWWPLSTASGSYTLWVAWPRLTRDTLYRLTSEQEPYVAAKVAQELRKLTSLKQDAGKAPTSAQAKAIGAQEDFVAELTALRDELAMVAPMWNPVHDDGVVLHAALLWRVFRDAGWQKECREKWEGLVAGKYDWAHIAMHLWPERVVPKCGLPESTRDPKRPPPDRSLAIAHGLEDRFWVEIAGKWRLRDGTAATVDEEIASRTSAAVKKALRAMQEAPAPVRGRKGRKG